MGVVKGERAVGLAAKEGKATTPAREQQQAHQLDPARCARAINGDRPRKTIGFFSAPACFRQSAYDIYTQLMADEPQPKRLRKQEDRAYHARFMREALQMADLALQTDETPVGCVFVHDGRVIGRGMNDTNRSLNGTRHAEFVAISQILAIHPPSILRETDLYVTVEPCVMCASALRQFGIRAVYFGCWNDRFGGTGGVLNIHTEYVHAPPCAG